MRTPKNAALLLVIAFAAAALLAGCGSRARSYKGPDGVSGATDIKLGKAEGGGSAPFSALGK